MGKLLFAFFSIFICRLYNRKFAVYKGCPQKSSSDKNHIFKFSSIMNLIKEIAEKYALRKSPLMFVRGGVKNSNQFYISGNSLFNQSNLYERNDTCNSEKIILLNIASIIPRKSIKTIIGALNVLRSKGFNVHFQHIGEFTKENYSDIIKLVENYKLEKYVEFHGYINDSRLLEKMYRKADMFVLSSKMEGFPRVIIESMGQSLPVISTKVGGIKELFDNEDFILFFKTGEIEDLAFKIETMITNRILRKKLIKNGFAYAEKEYSLPDPALVIAEKIHNF